MAFRRLDFDASQIEGFDEFDTRTREALLRSAAAAAHQQTQQAERVFNAQRLSFASRIEGLEMVVSALEKTVKQREKSVEQLIQANRLHEQTFMELKRILKWTIGGMSAIGFCTVAAGVAYRIATSNSK